ncbi:hypothetical protein AKJ16_DCAP07525, partial [Drosera capensis]
MDVWKMNGTGFVFLRMSFSVPAAAACSVQDFTEMVSRGQDRQQYFLPLSSVAV